MISAQTAKRALAWENPPFDKQTRAATLKLKAENPIAFEDAFYKDLAFGTGGMRGVMGIGTNRVNTYTFGRTTQGLANYLKQSYPNLKLKAVIAYDCRHQSDTLARTVAGILTANGVEVFLFKSLRPTPELSFAVRHLECHCGLVLTASHNPPEYNGYKVYWTDGGQIVPPQDQEIIQAIEKTTYEDIQFEENPKLLHLIDQEVDKPFIEAVLKNGKIGHGRREDFKIVFTALHGTSITLLPQVLENAGYTGLSVVEAQAQPDGNFPTVISPNPEEPEALKMALAQAEETQADMVVGTDPDADRLGIAVRNQKDELILLNGNQAMVVMTDYLLEKHHKENRLPSNAFIASTVVSTPMMQEIAKHYKVECKLGLTGFKWIAKMIQDFPSQYFVGGGEESFGYMVGDFVRDKDAITATLLACEIAAEAKTFNSSFFDRLMACYERYGFYKEKLVSFVNKGKDGAEAIKKKMADLRAKPLKSIDNSPVVRLEDYASSTLISFPNKNKSSLNFPKSDVLIYETADGTRVAARPSGTEPKIKFYISVKAALKSKENFTETNTQLEAKIDRILEEWQLKS